MIRTARAALTLAALMYSHNIAHSSEDDYSLVLRQVREVSRLPTARLLKSGRSRYDRMIPAVVITDAKTPLKHKKRVLLVSGQHGDEISAVRATLDLATNLARGAHPQLIRSCIIVVVPMVNPDGVSAHSRYNAAGMDINRDWEEKKSHEARYVDSLIKLWRPQVIIDVHEWKSPTLLPSNGIEIARSGQSSRDTAIADLARSASHTSRMHFIVSRQSSDHRLFHRHYTACGYAAYLLETGVGENYHIKRRFYSSAIRTMLKSLASGGANIGMMSPSAIAFRPEDVATYLDEPVVFDMKQFIAVICAITIGWCVILWRIRPVRHTETPLYARKFKVTPRRPDAEPEPLFALAHGPRPPLRDIRTPDRI